MQLLVSCFIVVFLVACGSGRASAPSPNERSSSETKNSPQQEPSSEATEFEDIQGGRGKTEDGFPFSYHLYKSSDGVGVSTTVENRGSAVRANQALQQRVKTATKIIEQGANLDDKKHRVGERVVAIFPSDGSGKEHTVVLWTEGSHFHYLESSSLRHVLTFEKMFYR
jgi:hypothetical protein